MQRLFNITKWRLLGQGQGFAFASERPRVVRFEVNAPQAACLYLQAPESGETIFVARCEGRDTVELHVGGGFVLVADADVWIYSADGETIHHVNEDPEIYTRITERRQRNPELDAIARAMNINIERRLAAQRDEFNAHIRQLQRDRAVASRREADEAAIAAAASATADDSSDVPAKEPLPDAAPAPSSGDTGGNKRRK